MMPVDESVSFTPSQIQTIFQSPVRPQQILAYNDYLQPRAEIDGHLAALVTVFAGALGAGS